MIQVFDLGINDMESSVAKDNFIDVERGEIATIDEQVARQFASSNGQGKNVLSRAWSGVIGIDGLVRGEENMKCAHSNSNCSEVPIIEGEIIAEKMFDVEEDGSLSGTKVDAEKTKKKSCRKPPRPPRPPKSPPMDAADQKLMRELSEFAMLKRARIDRMKKKLNTKSTTSMSNSCALFVTIIFCLVIVWQGFSFRGNSNISFNGSPESSLRTRGGLITIQFNKNASRYFTNFQHSISQNQYWGWITM